MLTAANYRPAHGGYPVEHALSATPAVVGELRAGDSLVILMSGGPMDAATAAAMRERFRRHIPYVRDVVFIANAVGAVVCRAEEPTAGSRQWNPGGGAR